VASLRHFLTEGWERELNQGWRLTGAAGVATAASASTLFVGRSHRTDFMKNIPIRVLPKRQFRGGPRSAIGRPEFKDLGQPAAMREVQFYR